MAFPTFADTRLQAIGAILIIVVAVVVGLTNFKFSKPKNTLLQNTHTMQFKFPGQLPAAETKVNVRLTTTRGDILIQLMPDQAPLAASNFVYLVKQKFYDGIVWHRVEDWVVQAGDPQTLDPSVPKIKWGTGGPGYTIPDEKVTGDYLAGVVAMARTPAPDSAGSQIFILKRDTPLEKVYAIFGKVLAGMDVVNALTTSDKIQQATIEPTA